MTWLKTGNRPEKKAVPGYRLAVLVLSGLLVLQSGATVWAADDAQRTADGVQTVADDAQPAADDAQTVADDAQTAADGAQTVADDAQSAADSVQNVADDAQTATDGADMADIAALQERLGMILFE